MGQLLGGAPGNTLAALGGLGFGPTASASLVGGNIAGAKLYKEATRQLEPKAPKKPEPPETVDKTALASAVRKRQQAMLAAGGRQGTIRTGPLGLLGEPALANKTLLGA